MWKHIARFILRGRIYLIGTICLLTIFMGYKASQVQMSYKQKSILPSTDSTIINYKKFSKKFGKEGDVIFLITEHKDFWESKNLQRWIDFGYNLQKVNGIDAVASVTHNTQAFIKDSKNKKFIAQNIFPKKINNNKQIDSLRKKLDQIKFYNNKLYDKRSNSYIMLLTVNSKIIDSKERIPFLKKIKKEVLSFSKTNNYKIRITGLPYVRIETAQMIKKEMFLFMILSALVTAIILYLFFRSFRTMFFSLAVVALTAVWAVGTMSILGYEITVLTAMLPPLLIVIGIPNCIFMVNKYHGEYKKHKNKIMALQRVIMRVGNAILLTNLTTTMGFATFVITSSGILVEFGTVATINIMLLFVFSIILIPCIFSLLPPPKTRHIRHLDYKYINIFLKHISVIIKQYRKFVYTLTVLIIIVSAIGIYMLKTTGYVVDDLPHESKIMQDIKFFEKNYGGIMPFEVIVDTKKHRGVMQLKTLKAIDKFSTDVSKMPYFSAPISVVEIAKYMNQSFYNGVTSQYRLPSNQSTFNYLQVYAKNSVQKINKNSKLKNMMHSYVDKKSQQTRITFYMKDVGNVKMQAIQKKLNRIAAKTLNKKHYDVSMTGSSVVFYKGTEYLVRNLFISLALAILLIACFMAFMFSSIRMITIALIPNIIPLLVTAGLMGFFGIPIKASTILIFSIAFGISVDDTIHFLAKYRQDLGITKWKIKESIGLALKETGQSMLYTSIVLFCGFMIFSFSDFGGTKALGILVSITLLTAMFSNLIVLPSLLMSLEKRISNKKFSKPQIRIYEDNETIPPE